MDAASLKELVCSGALDEIPNAVLDDGFDSIKSFVRGEGMVKDGKTCKAVLFVVYQTGRHGPQNGFRLALVQEGVKLDDATEQLRRAVEQETAEFVVVRPN